jgi:hypothetical protein
VSVTVGPTTAPLPSPPPVVRSKPRYKKHVIRLAAAEREELERKVAMRNGPRRDVVRARAILLSDASDLGLGYTDERIAVETGLSVRTIEALRKRFVEEGMASAVSWRRSRPGAP